MNTNICHDNIAAKNFESTTNTRGALVYHGLYGFVAERISHTAFNIPYLLSVVSRV